MMLMNIEVVCITNGGMSENCGMLRYMSPGRNETRASNVSLSHMFTLGWLYGVGVFHEQDGDESRASRRARPGHIWFDPEKRLLRWSAREPISAAR